MAKHRSRSGRPAPRGRVTPKGVRPPGSTPPRRSTGATSDASASTSRRPVVDPRHDLHGRSGPGRSVGPRPGHAGDR